MTLSLCTFEIIGVRSPFYPVVDSSLDVPLDPLHSLSSDLVDQLLPQLGIQHLLEGHLHRVGPQLVPVDNRLGVGVKFVQVL